MCSIPAPQPYDHPPHPALDLARQLDGILCRVLHWLGFVLRPLGRVAFPLQLRLLRANERLAALLHRIAEGSYSAPRPRAPATPPRRGGTPAPYLPRRPGWLGTIAGFQMRNAASQLQSLLDRPETQATFAAAPAPAHARRAIARALGTPCRLLGVELPPILTPPNPPPPPRKPTPRAIPNPRPPLPPLRPLPAYVRAAVRAWKPRYG